FLGDGHRPARNVALRRERPAPVLRKRPALPGAVQGRLAMRVPLSWLRDFVDVPWSAKGLGTRLPMSGFELEALDTAAPPFSRVVVAEIVEAARHPQADKLQVCKGRAGQSGKELLQVVGGGANARAGLKTGLAAVGATLPGGHAIAAATLRGVESFGMLCSAKEL